MGRNEGSVSEDANVKEDNTPNLQSTDLLLSRKCFSHHTEEKTSEVVPENLYTELDFLQYDALECLAGSKHITVPLEKLPCC